MVTWYPFSYENVQPCTSSGLLSEMKRIKKINMNLKFYSWFYYKEFFSTTILWLLSRDQQQTNKPLIKKTSCLQFKANILKLTSSKKKKQKTLFRLNIMKKQFNWADDNGAYQKVIENYTSYYEMCVMFAQCRDKTNKLSGSENHDDFITVSVQFLWQSISIDT